jgi:hypothetical protein
MMLAMVDYSYIGLWLEASRCYQHLGASSFQGLN